MHKILFRIFSHLHTSPQLGGLRGAFLFLLLLFSIRVHAVTVETTNNLHVFYPDFKRIDLVCGKMPTTSDKDVEFCCEAAFTGELLSSFSHMNIADNHITGGVMKKGYRCKANTGAFLWRKGRWQFLRKVNYPTTANGWSMGFCQLLIVKDGKARPLSARMKSRRNIFRALCEKNGRLCIIETKRVLTYESFVRCLVGYKVTHALYLDMGSGWNYAWYRDADGRVKERFPESKSSFNYPFRTNWITFYKK